MKEQEPIPFRAENTQIVPIYQETHDSTFIQFAQKA